ncbi:Rv3235 family protein [Streptomyces albogriseolus]|uniref:Rv3235 family protein n=1 Tax=Streptomyces albogriseolus TaxID=1887 RepID=UPI003D747220
MSRTPRRSPAAVPPRVPTAGTPLSPSPGAGRPRGTTPRRTRPTDTRPAGRAPVRGSRTGSGAGTPSAPPPEPTSPGATGRPAGTPPDSRGGSSGTPPEPLGVPQPRPADRFAELLVAVLSGQRPVHAMLRHSAGQAYDELIRLAERGPLRTRGARPVVRDIGWFVPREGAIEAFARIGAGDRLRAMAFRLERGRDLRWRCTAVELGGPR